MRIVISHYLPVVTRCPVNRLPDVLYLEAEFDGQAEVYEVRRLLTRGFFLRLMWMEQVVETAAQRLRDFALREGVQLKAVRLRVAGRRVLIEHKEREQ